MSDLLDIKKINNFSPIVIEMRGSKYDLMYVCVETGCAKINVAGLTQNAHWEDFSVIYDGGYNKHDPDDFYLDD